jgi:hypothetical protein
MHHLSARAPEWQGPRAGARYGAAGVKAVAVTSIVTIHWHNNAPCERPNHELTPKRVLAWSLLP